MLDFPETTLFNRIIPKAKFYEKLTLKPALRNIFINEIGRIVWRNKLSPITLNVREGGRVREIEVLEITLKSNALNDAALKVIDKGIPYHTLFLLKNDEELYIACMGFKDFESQSVSEYFKTGWMAFSDLPLRVEGLTLDEVYDNFIRQLNPGLRSAGDCALEDALAEDARRKKLEREIARLESQMRKEKQPKRKFELHLAILELRDKL